MDEMFQEIMMTCDLLDIPLEDAEYWYEHYLEFVREEFESRLKGNSPNKINPDILKTVIVGDAMYARGC